MKITRYPQSCMLIEKHGRKIVIDPGNGFKEKYGIQEFDGVEAVLYTHLHPDHADPELAENFQELGVELYGNAATSNHLTSVDVNLLENQVEAEIAGFTVKALDIDHCAMPDGSEGPQNTGFLIDEKFFHPGDGKYLEGLGVESLALPIQGPDVSFRDANDFARQLKVKRAIPIHYDLMGAKPEVYKMFSEGFGMTFQIEVLALGESVKMD
jgi:L-ascorbate metabolism protein UlaG (beta-lactamase superfamily)